jgi:hypothetical protein
LFYKTVNSRNPDLAELETGKAGFLDELAEPIRHALNGELGKTLI